MPEPAGLNTALLFLCMNRYVSVRRDGKSLPANIPKPDSCFCIRNYDETAKRQAEKGVSATEKARNLPKRKKENQMGS